MSRNSLGPVAIAASFLVPSLCMGQVMQERPRDFVQSLALSHVPAGIVIHEAKFAQARGAAPDKATAGVAVGDVKARMELFNVAGQAFRALRAKRVVHVRSIEEPTEVTQALERSISIKRAMQIKALRAVYSLVAEAISGAAPMGIAGSGVPAGPECPLDQVVRIPQGSPTAIALLDEIVEQTPGLAWLVTYNPDLPHADLNIGVMCSDGSYETINVFP